MNPTFRPDPSDPSEPHEPTPCCDHVEVPCEHGSCGAHRRGTQVPSVHTVCGESDPDGKLGCLRQRFGRLWEITLPEGDARAMDIVDWNLGETVVVTGAYPARHLRRTAPMLHADQLDHYVLWVELDGPLTLHADTRDIAVEAGEAAIVDLSKEVRIETPGGRCLQVFIPCEALEDLLSQPFPLHAMRLHGAAASLLTNHLRAFTERLGSMGREEAMRIAGSAMHLLATAIEHTPAIDDGAGRSGESTLLRQACRYIELHLKDESLSAARLCDAMHMSRATLYRLFQRYGGIAHYIRDRRLMAIHAILSDPQRRRSVTSIAGDYSFASVGQLSATFKRRFGYSPRDVPIGAIAHEAFGETELGGSEFSDWLMSLRG